MTHWPLQALQAFAARHLPGLEILNASPFTSGFWNDVQHLTTTQGDLVFKRYRPTTNPLFPNLPADEARALHRLAGLNVAPDLIHYAPQENVLIYRYIPGPEWSDDVTAAAHLLTRQSHADPTGFRPVPTTAAAIIAQADQILTLCTPNPTTQALHSCRPLPQTTAPAPISLIHTDPAPANLISHGQTLRLIDWQCPAAGDLAEDVSVLLSPTFRTLYNRPLLTPNQRAHFLHTLNMPALTARLTALQPAYEWRLACYCAHRAQTAPDPALAQRYQTATETYPIHFGLNIPAGGS